MAKVAEDQFLQAKLLEWEAEPSVAVAVDILSSSIVLGRGPEHQRIAWWVLALKEDLAPVVIELAKMCAHGRGRLPDELPRTRIQAQALVNRYRHLATSNPRDAVLYVDTALAHSVLGNLERAERAMKVATQLAPNNRFVLRSGARFWIHAGDPDRARALLQRTPRSGQDPWLASAELAVSSVVGKPPKFFKPALAMASGKQFSPQNTSELAGSIGTLEMLEGAHKKARGYFSQSLINPTENSVAQAVWARNAQPSVRVEFDEFPHLQMFEGRTLSARFSGRWDEALENCNGWVDLEPFSTRAPTLGSFIGIVSGNVKAAKALAERGVESNPRDFVLLNNLAIANLVEGNVQAARSRLSAAMSVANDTPSGDALDNEQRTVLMATEGMFAFRAGDVERGRVLYRRSVESAVANGLRPLAAFAAAFWAREELAQAGGKPDGPIELFEVHQKSVRDQPEVEIFKKELLGGARALTEKEKGRLSKK